MAKPAVAAVQQVEGETDDDGREGERKIDECVDEHLRLLFPGYDCQTARFANLAGLKNGEILAAAEALRFDVFITADQGIEYQQNLAGRTIAIIILRTKSNRLKDLLPRVPACLEHIETDRCLFEMPEIDGCWDAMEEQPAIRTLVKTNHGEKLAVSQRKTYENFLVCGDRAYV